MSSDMALRFSGLLKVMTPTPSVTPCRILPSAKDLSVAFGIFSIGALSAIGGSRIWIEALPRCLGNGGRSGAIRPLPQGERLYRVCGARLQIRPAIVIPTHLLCEM